MTRKLRKIRSLPISNYVVQEESCRVAGQLMRWPVGAERAVGSGKAVQSSDEAVLLAFFLLFS